MSALYPDAVAILAAALRGLPPTADRAQTIAIAELALDGLADAGYAVVKLPDPDEWDLVQLGEHEEGNVPVWLDGQDNAWRAWNEGVEDQHGLTEDLASVRRTALAILAAVAASERFAAEHRETKS